VNKPVTPSEFDRRALTPIRRGTIVALDIGSSKVACLIGEHSETGEAGQGLVRISGFGHQHSEGLIGGQVVDMRKAEDSIRAAVDAAERMAGMEVRNVVIGISANQVTSDVREASVPISGHPVTLEHMASALRLAYEEFWLEDHEILHAIPIGYGIDGHYGISDPSGMYGDVLSVQMHLISAPVGPIRNLLTCIEQCHLQCEKLVVTPYASALSTLMQDEVDLGVLHIDMGGGTTSASVFYEGEPIFTTIVPVGGQHITNDIAHGLNVSLTAAERIKTLYGSALETPHGEREQFEVPVIGGDYQTLPRSELTNIIRPRLEETFEMVNERLLASGMGHLAGRRVVVTGGAAQLNGALELAQTILEKQPRLALPMRLTGLPEAAAGPSFAACAGLLTYAGRNHADAVLSSRTPRLFGWFSAWLKRNF
jgi:cell division protein FtsA